MAPFRMTTLTAPRPLKERRSGLTGMDFMAFLAQPAGSTIWSRASIRCPRCCSMRKPTRSPSRWQASPTARACWKSPPVPGDVPPRLARINSTGMTCGFDLSPNMAARTQRLARRRLPWRAPTARPSTPVICLSAMAPSTPLSAAIFSNLWARKTSAARWRRFIGYYDRTDAWRWC